MAEGIITRRGGVGGSTLENMGFAGMSTDYSVGSSNSWYTIPFDEIIDMSDNTKAGGSTWGSQLTIESIPAIETTDYAASWDFTTNVGRFTAPKAGIYLMTANAAGLDSQTTSASHFGLRLIKNGVTDIMGYNYMYFESTRYQNGCNSLCELSIGDWIEVQGQAALTLTVTRDATTNTDDWYGKSYFGAIYLGEAP